MTLPRCFPYLLRLGDDRLVLGHRLSEWCGHGPILEEDIALANIALDLIGQATLLLKLAGAGRRRGRDEDALAYFRDATDYRNVLAGRAAARAISRSRSCASSSSASFSCCRWRRCTRSTNADARRHRREGGQGSALSRAPRAQWVVTLGDGTEESHARAQTRARRAVALHRRAVHRRRRRSWRPSSRASAWIPSRSRRRGARRSTRSCARGDARTPADGLHAARRPRRAPHRASGPSACGNADRGAITSGSRHGDAGAHRRATSCSRSSTR